MGSAIEVFLLMYAEDIVLLGDTVLELQKKSIYLKNSVISWGGSEFNKDTSYSVQEWRQDIQVREVYIKI